MKTSEILKPFLFNVLSDFKKEMKWLSITLLISIVVVIAFCTPVGILSYLIGLVIYTQDFSTIRVNIALGMSWVFCLIIGGGAFLLIYNYAKNQWDAVKSGRNPNSHDF